MADARPQPGRRYVRIVSVPPGEAPDWVREKWVGLELPLAAGERGLRNVYYTSGVLTGPPNLWVALLQGVFGRLPRQSGYAVYVSEALGILEQSAPEAASWWRQNTPRLLVGKRKFLFQEQVCELIAPAAGAS